MSKESATRLLLVEDNPGDVRLLREMFNELGSHNIELMYAASMNEAEKDLAERAVDVVLLDLGLPDVQGLGAVRRAHAAAPRVPLVVLTGLDDESLAVRALREGAQDYLVKGQIQAPGLMRAIRYAIERMATEEALRESESRYRALAEGSPLAIFVNRNDKVVLANAACVKLFGASSPEDLVGTSALELFHPDSQGLVRERIREDSETVPFVEVRIVRLDGTPMDVEATASPLLDQGVNAIQVVLRDISVRKAAEEHLAQMEGRYRGLLEAAPDAMVVVNGAGEIVLLNLQAENQFGYHRDELVGQPVTNIIPEGFAERLIADDLRSAADALAQQIGTGIELSGRRKDGTEFPIEIMLSPLESAEGILVTAAIRDISARKDAESVTRVMGLQMTHSAQHDFLTGLPNRMLLSDRIGQAIFFASRHATHVAVLFLDLDGFKHINDSLGHPIGDKLLQSIARRLVECVRASDTVSRQGGDEFVVLLSEAEEWDDAAMVARRVLQAVAESHSIDQHDLRITTSIGVSVYPDDGEDAETLIKNADTAMYQAKENGRQRYQFFAPAMNVRAVERQSVEEGLRRALERQELVLHYQPKIDLRTGAIIGSEALIRWTHPTRGLVSPAQFIPIAEDCGLILPIDHWVLREACEQARVWLDAGLPAATIAVNVSAMELEDPTFLEGLFAILKKTRLDPRSLEVELTESVLMKHAESAASILRILRERGIQVAIDDFGTGYSSLSYLRKFAVDALKIDQSFVSQITSAGDDVSLVTAVMSMARSLKLRVVAEGVETSEQLAFLQALDCDEAQGFYFSRPVPPEQFAELLRTGMPGAGRSVDGSDRVPVGSDRHGRGRVTQVVGLEPKKTR